MTKDEEILALKARIMRLESEIEELKPINRLFKFHVPMPVPSTVQSSIQSSGAAVAADRIQRFSWRERDDTGG